MVIEFVCWVVVVALSAAFLLSLITKWGWMEWLQVHAPNEFFERLLNCKFCRSWWVCVIISLTLCVMNGQLMMLAVPICSTIICRELW